MHIYAFYILKIFNWMAYMYNFRIIGCSNLLDLPKRFPYQMLFVSFNSCLSLCPFIFAIVLYVLRFTASDYYFGLFNLFLDTYQPDRLRAECPCYCHLYMSLECLSNLILQLTFTCLMLNAVHSSPS